MFRGREDFIEVNGNTEGDKEEAANARAFPVWGLKRWGGNELIP